MLQTYKFDSGLKGPKLLLLGAIHGDETCGVVALSKIVQQFESRAIFLKKGSVTIVPMCNPKAYEKNVRFIDRNLNRYMSPISNPSIYEDDLTNALCPLLEDADVLLDIHSYHVGGAPFIFVEGPDGEEVPYAKSLGIDHLVYGFQNSYANADGALSEEALKKGMGTTEYIRQFGGYGITLECGQHLDPKSINVAEDAILKTLQYLGMAEGNVLGSASCKMIKIQKLYYKQLGAEFCEEWCNFQFLPKGTKIIEYSGGDALIAQEDGYIVLPRIDTPVGEEWFYLGRGTC